MSLSTVTWLFFSPSHVSWRAEVEGTYFCPRSRTPLLSTVEWLFWGQISRLFVSPVFFQFRLLACVVCCAPAYDRHLSHPNRNCMFDLTSCPTDAFTDYPGRADPTSSCLQLSDPWVGEEDTRCWVHANIMLLDAWVSAFCPQFAFLTGLACLEWLSMMNKGLLESLCWAKGMNVSRPCPSSPYFSSSSSFKVLVS
ncbi:hypothetical protein BCR44DRAFT_1427074 [Catenaria anguillulae PL171]|uniref:Uncharacterized protein n=1 Tax=Catenaria anguillulae PL171 TaxID=765915 RepID=A0A1Y2HWQ4_9FUNG|nr:hypothetical protein BCR44DRAFT_1427074 [Catenaria anguillulae PL171]